MDDEELEYTLLNKRDVLVYQIPPASSSAGHKADDWKKCIWRGSCRIAGKGRDLTIKMIDAGSGQLFAQCVIPNGEHDKYVERAIDSSRYFVLKITNGQRHAFIGLGFEDRNDAFDFNCTLSDFKSTWVDREEAAEAPAPASPAKDLSLKEGQKITLNLRGMEGREGRARRAPGPEAGGGFAGLLAPPPSSGQSRRQPSAAAAAPPPAAPAQRAAAPAAPAAPQEDLFGDFADFQSADLQPAAPAPAPAAPAPAPAPGAGFAAPFEAQFEQLSLGGAAPRAPAAQPPLAQVAPPVPSDPFVGFGMFGDGSPQAGARPAAMAPPQQTTMQFNPAPQGPPPQRARDPFDEFDIFK